MNTNELRACPLECRTDPVLCSDGHKVFCPLCGFSAPINSWNRRAAVELMFADAVKDAARYRKVRHYCSSRLMTQMFMLPEVMVPQVGWSTENWTDAIVDSVEPIDTARSAVSPGVTK